MKKRVDLAGLHREEIGAHTLERYTGSSPSAFQPYILLVNFHRYVELFAEMYDAPIQSGTVMSVCHVPKQRMTIINYTVGSPMAALILELLSFVKVKAIVVLGMCGGLRKGYKIGSFFLPVAAIRDEGTSHSFMPPQCPALSSFVIQRYLSNVLEKMKQSYSSGVIHTTNIRFWEFKKEIIDIFKTERAQAVDMECATLFSVGFYHSLPVGALMLISDLPLNPKKIKTVQSGEFIFKKHAQKQLKIGVSCLAQMQKEEKKGFHYLF